MLLVEGIERVEKLLLRRILARDELNVVDQQRIHLAVFVSELLLLLFVYSLDKLIREILALYIGDVCVRIVKQDIVRYRVHEVGLSDSRRSVDEEGVVLLCGMLRDVFRHRMCEHIRFADDEVVEGIVGIVI